ncbi:MAG: pirin family protein [Jatrophihabitantaceae bacterium]
MALFRRRPEQLESVRPAAARSQSAQPGIRSWHDFSAGGHYDPDNLGFGALVGFDEHLLEPGAGFAAHTHRGVEILSWVLEGELRHEDESGATLLLRAGTVLHQSSGAGTRHAETNASAAQPLRIVQLTVLGGTATPSTRVVRAPVLVPGAGLLAVLSGKAELETRGAYLHVVRGSFSITKRYLQPGDSLCLQRTMSLAGDGEVLLWVPAVPPAGGRAGAPDERLGSTAW